MNKLLTIALLSLLAAFAGCKKNKNLAPLGDIDNTATSISAIEPSVVSVNAIITIKGKNFGTTKSAVSVKFNTEQASIQSVTDTEIKVVVPPTVSGTIYLTINNITIKGPEYTYQMSIEGAIATSISPSTVSAGTVVTIGGNNFDQTGKLKVWMNGVEATIQSSTAREIKVVTPVTTSGNIVIASGNNTFQGPPFSFYGPVSVGQLSPAEGPVGTIVALTGLNFGTDRSRVQVLFDGVAGSVQSVTNTEIRVTVPTTKTGKVTVVIGDQRTDGPVFTFLSPLTSVYSGGNVVFNSQADVDAFVALNKGKQLQLTGSLTIIGNDIRSVSGLSNITSVSNTLSIGATPLLTDLSFLNNITTVGGGITFASLAGTTVTMDNLAGTIAYLDVSTCKNLQTLSFKSLSNVIGIPLRGGINITGSSQLDNIDFSNLKGVSYGLSLIGTAMVDFSKFAALKTVGKLLISSNLSLSSLKGLEGLTSLSMTAYTIGLTGGATTNGLKILSNPKLSSLAGLKNLSTVPLAQITGNAALNDLCPMKTVLLSLSTTPNFVVRSSSLNSPRTQTFEALTLTSNGSYATEAEALKALEDCK